MKKNVTHFIEAELITLLAVIILLGVIFGYSLAAGKTTQSSSTSILKMSSSVDTELPR